MFKIKLFSSESVKSILGVLKSPRDFKGMFCNTLKNILDNPCCRDQLLKMKRFDNGVYYHCLNVAIIAGMIYYESSTPQTTMKEVVSAGLFHDIGKEDITKDILLSTKKLSEKERKIINTHPKTGFKQAQKIMISNQAKQGILSHHEDVAGSGYPKHLEGDDIPVVGRILRIADTYDALVAKRSYKSGMSSYDAAEYIILHEGALFDVKFTNLFHKIRNGGI